jgi:hypothetical protein
MRAERIRQERQATYRETHRERARRRGEPTGRDVGAALVELYAEAAATARATSHAGLVERLAARGFNRHASADFIERLVRRVREASVEDEPSPSAQC